MLKGTEKEKNNIKENYFLIIKNIKHQIWLKLVKKKLYNFKLFNFYMEELK